MAAKKKAGKKAEMQDDMLLTDEEAAHREHLKRQKKHKKKKTQLIVGLCLEVLLLAVVIVGFVVTSYAEKWINAIHSLPTEDVQPSGQVAQESSHRLPNLDPSNTQADDTTAGHIVVSDPNEDTTEIITRDPSMEWTNPVENNAHEKMQGYYTYVCFGVDARGSNLLKYTQGDVVIIVSINRETYEVRMASVYRDYYLEAMTDYFCKLTDCYARFGAEETMAALNRNLDLEIQEMVCVNWKILGVVVDSMGGIDIDMTEKEAIEVNNYIYETMVATGLATEGGIPMEAGVHHCDGVNTICYSRIRYNVGNDYARTDRQRKVIGLMLQKAKTMSLSALLKTVTEATQQVYTNINTVDIIQMATKVLNLHITNSSGFPFHQKTVEFIYADDLEWNVKELHKFLYDDEDYEPSANVKRIAVQHAAEIRTYFGGN